MSTIACLVTTYERPAALARSLPQIAALGRPVLVIDDGSDGLAFHENLQICSRVENVRYVRLPDNRGLAAVLNVGLSYWLADKSIEWISYFQDDVDVHPLIMREIEKAIQTHPANLYTGHDSAYHATAQSLKGYKIKRSCAGVHMHGCADFWRSILPIPTYVLGAPKRVQDGVKGIGSNVDWWIVRDAPRSIAKRGEMIVCLPNLVRTFSYRSEDSCWGNFLPKGEEPPLEQLS